ncbi:hypothetical protein GXB85_13520 [Cellulomonas sp. APG4]|uniref:hypothetical protein n=1 Tax=Cellulomonas sp. APG4 TaxID=1538656 RepID=UPI00137A92A7|nr:hypothetical protein [Cellulomonas sp. APG4]NCT91961.1 hypothetical protein [Cellulomonas sp. APG4]
MTAEGEDTAAALRRIELSVHMVRRWSALLLGQVQAPEPGSRLARDDELFPALPTSTVTWYAMNSAIDHLDLGADLLQAENATVLRPSAFYSITRSALLGAAQALWILAGDDDERAIRSLLVVHDEAHMQSKFLRAYLDDATFAADVTPQLVEKMKDDDGRLRARLSTVKAELKQRGRHRRFESTEVIKEVARWMAPRERWLRRAILDQWMRGSAAAHSRMWSLHVRPAESEPSPDGTGVVRRTTTTPEDVAQAYGAPTLILQEALRLWDRDRRVARPATPFLIAEPIIRPTLHP